MKIKLADIKDVSELEGVRIKAVKAHCSKTYDKDQIKAIVSKAVGDESYEKSVERSSLFIITEKGNVGGYIQFRYPGKVGTKSSAYIEGVFITKDFSSKGFARKLMQKVEDGAIERGITQVKLITTKNAEPFFNHLGYDISGPALRQTIDGQVINLQPLFKALVIPAKDKS